MSSVPRILIVDDDPDIGDWIRCTLAIAGIYAKHVSTAMDAVRDIRQNPPSLILMDIQMPGLDGAVAAGLLSEAGALNGIPVVLMSALPESELQRKAEEAGASDILAKPFNMPKLVSCVFRWLREGHVGSTLAGGRVAK